MLRSPTGSKSSRSDSSVALYTTGNGVLESSRTRSSGPRPSPPPWRREPTSSVSSFSRSTKPTLLSSTPSVLSSSSLAPGLLPLPANTSLRSPELGLPATPASILASMLTLRRPRHHTRFLDLQYGHPSQEALPPHPQPQPQPQPRLSLPQLQLQPRLPLLRHALSRNTGNVAAKRILAAPPALLHSRAKSPTSTTRNACNSAYSSMNWLRASFTYIDAWRGQFVFQ